MELQKWIDANHPSDDMIWKLSWWDQVKFVKSIIPRAFLSEKFNVKISVIGSHTSKSIDLPVYMVEAPGIKFIMRNNFYDWKVSVMSMNPLPGLQKSKTFDHHEEINSCYCEGFKDSEVYGSYVNSNILFTVSIYDKYSLFMFMKTIANEFLI